MSFQILRASIFKPFKSGIIFPLSGDIGRLKTNKQQISHTSKMPMRSEIRNRLMTTYKGVAIVSEKNTLPLFGGRIFLAKSQLRNYPASLHFDTLMHVGQKR